MVDVLQQALTVGGFPGFAEDRNKVFLKVGKSLFDSFETMSIKRSFNTLCSSFQIFFADKWRDAGENWDLIPGAPVVVSVGPDPIFTGYIDRLDTEVSNDDRKIEVEGRDRTSDLVDCAATVTLKTELKNVFLLDICSNFTAQFGIACTLATGVRQGAIFPKFSAKQDETVFECMERAAKLRGLLLISDFMGNLTITNRGSGGVERPSSLNLVPAFDFVAGAPFPLPLSQADLQQGVNVLKASASYNETDRFQQYIVKGQNRGTSNARGLISSQVQSVAFDAGVSRFRPVVILAEGAVDVAAALARAQWEATTRAAKAVQVAITVQGWRKPDGKLWAENALVSVDLRFVGIQPRQMLVTDVEFSKDNKNGTLTHLRLTRADAFNAQPTVAKETGQMGWGDFKATDILK